jgi:DNA-binding NarL/FixJ family response regulator
MPMRVETQGAVAESSSPELSVVILSDIRFLRESLLEIFRSSREVKVLGQAAEFGEALDRSLSMRPDILLIDTAFPEGLAAARRIKQLAPQVRIIALALAETQEDVVAWAEAGISGYVPRSTGLSDVVVILQKAMRDEQACSGRVANGLMRRIAEIARLIPTVSSDSTPLTKRELEILQLINHGLSNKEIAHRLNIGLATTKTHVHNVLGKLGLGRRGQVAGWMRKQGPLLVSPVSPHAPMS